MNKSYEEHLEELYEYYRPGMVDITADQILTRVKTKPDVELTFDENIQLINDIVEELKTIYNGKYNILVENKINNLVNYMLNNMEFEIGVLLLKMVQEYIPIASYKLRIVRNEELEIYFKYLI